MRVEYMIETLLDRYQSQIQLIDYNELKELLHHDEWGIAFEHLCATLEQDKIGITLSDYKTIVSLGEYFEYNSVLWDCLQIIDV